MAKFYAVRCGRKTGVFTSWDECKAQVSGFSDAVFKSFKNLQDAEDYVNNVPDDPESAIVENQDGKPYAFVDGSFNDSTGEYGFGGFLFDGNVYHIIRGRGYDKEMLEMRNVAGEIQCVIESIKKANSLGLTSLTIYYDYDGIRAWIDGTWKAKKTGTIKYTEFIKKQEMKIDFIHVNAHTGVVGNEYADVLAKSAIGINLTRTQKQLYSDVMKLCESSKQQKL